MTPPKNPLLCGLNVAKAILFISLICVLVSFLNSCKGFEPILTMQTAERNLETYQIELDSFLKYGAVLMTDKNGELYQQMYIQDGKIITKTDRTTVKQHFQRAPDKSEKLDKVIQIFALFLGIVFLICGLIVFLVLMKK